MVGHAGSRQAALRSDEAVDPTHRLFPPLDVEGCELRIEFEMRIGKMIMDPPGEPTPVRAHAIAVGEPGHDHACRRTHQAALIAQVPDVIGGIKLDPRAMPAGISEGRHLFRPVAGSYLLNGDFFHERFCFFYLR